MEIDENGSSEAKYKAKILKKQQATAKDFVDNFNEIVEEANNLKGETFEENSNTEILENMISQLVDQIDQIEKDENGNIIINFIKKSLAKKTKLKEMVKKIPSAIGQWLMNKVMLSVKNILNFKGLEANLLKLNQLKEIIENKLKELNGRDHPIDKMLQKMLNKLLSKVEKAIEAIEKNKSKEKSASRDIHDKIEDRSQHQKPKTQDINEISRSEQNNLQGKNSKVENGIAKNVEKSEESLNKKNNEKAAASERVGDLKQLKKIAGDQLISNKVNLNNNSITKEQLSKLDQIKSQIGNGKDLQAQMSDQIVGKPVENRAALAARNNISADIQAANARGSSGNEMTQNASAAARFAANEGAARNASRVEGNERSNLGGGNSTEVGPSNSPRQPAAAPEPVTSNLRAEQPTPSTPTSPTSTQPGFFNNLGNGNINFNSDLIPNRNSINISSHQPNTLPSNNLPPANISMVDPAPQMDSMPSFLRNVNINPISYSDQNNLQRPNIGEKVRGLFRPNIAVENNISVPPNTPPPINKGRGGGVNIIN